MKNETNKTFYYGGRKFPPGAEFPKDLKIPPTALKQKDKPTKADKSNDNQNAEAEKE